MIKHPIQLRIEIARGHWSLGEYDDAVSCLERAAGVEGDQHPLMVMVGTLLDDVAAGPVVERLIVVRDRLLLRMQGEVSSPVPQPLATTTMAQLLAEQGHPEKARAVAHEALLRNPQDDRARALHESLSAAESPGPGARVLVGAPRVIATLERWLAAAQRRVEGKAQA